MVSYIPAVAAPWKGAQPEAEKALINERASMDRERRENQIKTFRTSRSSEDVLFSESSSILVSMKTRQANRHEKLFERSEFFE